ncbi:MAG TPA: NAD-dependent epimerase/dehydratase family protein [Candidatus Omnitrophota bacterium]|nr:NAD-dependent epimerase/dehydratase family protein [Candidatus Omnitrophota bacterium]HNQ50628.1 NAD-dependent epimerase/dehydratase family protein [Candidatus Omnitrophota bacterium]HQO37666.1 NAD-dependent epimerase/dehydratase family protein [Candidatus Omnitrophota bacterium]
MNIALITGAAGLIGSEAVRFFSSRKFKAVGIDNDMRRYFFGAEASTRRTLDELLDECPDFSNTAVDIRDYTALCRIFSRYGRDIKIVIHTAAQPSHDWAAREPFTDFSVNAGGTLNLLEAARRYCPNAVFIFTSTNKVYGDTPNKLPLVELATRWEVRKSHLYYKNGIDESMSIDQCKHSLFGASKAAADVMVQEYGRYFGMKTGVFRCGCLTGPRHSGVELHGFLAYLLKCAVIKREYRIFGYKGKQVRDNIHSFDLVNAFYHFFRDPRPAEVYNMGGSRFSNCSMLEAIRLCEQISGNTMKTRYVADNRIGDHIWWISDVSKFQAHFPAWKLSRDIRGILEDIFFANAKTWTKRT